MTILLAEIKIGFFLFFMDKIYNVDLFLPLMAEKGGLLIWSEYARIK